MLIFIDETGDHNLDKIDKSYPVFALGGLFIDEAEYKDMNNEIKRIKKDFFNDDGTFILHSSELKRPTHKRSDPRNIIMLKQETRKKFYETIDKDIMNTFNFKIILCIIKKENFVRKYKYPTDPYFFCFENLLNRIIKNGDNKNKIYAEKRNKELDEELETEYKRLCNKGIYKYESNIVKNTTSFKLIDKKENINGLQIIDLILMCKIRQLQGKKEKMINNDINYEFFENKIIKPITIFPQK